MAGLFFAGQTKFYFSLASSIVYSRGELVRCCLFSPCDQAACMGEWVPFSKPFEIVSESSAIINNIYKISMSISGASPDSEPPD